MKKIFVFAALTVALCGCKSGVENLNHFEHLAVKMEAGDDWSIIDAQGKLIAEEEYAADCDVSRIYNGTYWVKNKDGYNLYNVSDPKNPINDEPYEQATVFVNDRAFVAHAGKPIQLIAPDGSVVKDFGKGVSKVTVFSRDGYAVFQDAKTKLCGYLDRDGEVALPAKYLDTTPLTDDVTLVMTDSANLKKNILTIIDKEGKQTGKINMEKYVPLSLFFIDGLLPVIQKEAQTKRIEFIDKEGNKTLTLRKSEAYSVNGMMLTGLLTGLFNLWNGYAVYTDKDGKYGVADKNGESVIRAKYDMLENFGDGKFRAKRNDKWGVIDKDDKEILPFEYAYIYAEKLGGNYIVKDGSQLCVVGEDGKKAFNDEFNTFSRYGADSYITFVDVEDTKPVADVDYNGEDVDSIAVDTNVQPNQSYNSGDGGNAGGDDYDWLSTRLATSADIAGKSKAEIRIMRNYIFARHGYTFKDKGLQQHFAQYSWYSPQRSDVTGLLNSVEQKNIAFLKSYE